jgi:hypothetical protein
MVLIADGDDFTLFFMLMFNKSLKEDVLRGVDMRR